MNDTIAAISTAMNEAGIGIVRISGPDAFKVLASVFVPKNRKKIVEDLPSHTIHYGHIFDQEELIDEVLVMIMRAPHTYTGENTVEIDCHGGLYSLRRVLENVCKNGARIAEPGEFTRRAFLNGRLDLSQAEAVMDVIQAKNQYALKSSMEQLKGSVKGSIDQIRQELLYQIAFIESALDDPEHISLEGYPEQLLTVVREQKKKTDHLIETFDDGRIIREGIRTVILGKPNAGKSSLLNYMLGEDRAIVTDIAGTTRDTLEEDVNIGGITLRIIDTAGIRATTDQVEKIGVDRAKAAADSSDLILFMVDSSTMFDENDEEILSCLEEKPVIVLYNKTDLSPVVSAAEISKKINREVIPFSVKEKNGLEELTKKIREMFFRGKLSFNDEVYITNARHKEALMEASESLQMVEESIQAGLPEDFFSIDLRNCCESLGKILGVSLSEDLVNEIFNRFCIGK